MEGFFSFMNEVAPSLEWREIFWAFIVLLVGVLLQKSFAFFLSRHIQRRVSNNTNSTLSGIEHRVFQALIPPFHFIFIALSVFIASQILTLPSSIELIEQQLVHTFLIILTIWTFYKVIEPLSHVLNRIGRTDEEKRFNEELRGFLVSLIKFSILLIGVLSLLQNWGVNVTTFLAGLGLVGMAVSFAAQESIKQFFGSIALILDRPFEEGDWINIGDVEGIVTVIGLRTTTIRQIDHSLAVLPNSDLANAQIINKSQIKRWQINWTINLTYGTTAAQLKTIVEQIKSYLKQNSDIDMTGDDRFTMISLDKFNDSSIDIYCSFYTQTKDWVRYMEIKHDCVLAFKNIVEEAGSSFAFPSQSIYVEGQPKFNVSKMEK